jgi:cytidine deaminase
MIKAVVFDLQKIKLSETCSFLQKAKLAGLKLAYVAKAAPFKERPNPELYQRAFLDLGVGCDETVIISDSLIAQRTARNAKCVSVGIKACSEDALILKGADLVLDNLEVFPDFSTVEEFDAVLKKEVKAFYDRTIIGKLMQTAIKVREKAYAPYSNFKVGAGLLTETGKIYAGCNVENASLGATICAERGASMAALAAEGKKQFQMIAIASSAEDPAPPCAICRQFLSEFMPPDGQVFMLSVTSGIIKHYSFETLLPFTFTEF